MQSSVSPDTAARVREAIDELGYVPNRTAKALVSGHSHILGIIVSDITNPFFPDIIQGFEEVAIQHGYEIFTGFFQLRFQSHGTMRTPRSSSAASMESPS